MSWWLVAVAWLAGARAASPCSYETHSISACVRAAELVVVGRVDSLDQDIEYMTPDSTWSVRHLRTAFVAVEEVLKGREPAGTLALRFDLDLGGTSCDDLLTPYQRGARLLLILGPADQAGEYRAPTVPPEVAPVGTAYATAPLYRYVPGSTSICSPTTERVMERASAWLWLKRGAIPSGP